jgi:hypothetical protein
LHFYFFQKINLIILSETIFSKFYNFEIYSCFRTFLWSTSKITRLKLTPRKFIWKLYYSGIYEISRCLLWSKDFLLKIGLVQKKIPTLTIWFILLMYNLVFNYFELEWYFNKLRLIWESLLAVLGKKISKFIAFNKATSIFIKMDEHLVDDFLGQIELYLFR